MILNIFQLLGIVGLLLCLYEFIAMRHRDICAESDARMGAQFFYGRTPLFWCSGKGMLAAMLCPPRRR